MTDIYDLTNPITDALGDQHTLREVTMINHSSITRIEPLTNTSLPPGQTVLVRVIGDIGHEQLINQLQQINELKGFEVIGVTSVPVEDEGNIPSHNFTELTNCTENEGTLTYSGGLLLEQYPGYAALINPMATKLQVTVPENGQFAQIYGSIDASWAEEAMSNSGMRIVVEPNLVSVTANTVSINMTPAACESGDIIEIDLIQKTVKNLTNDDFAEDENGIKSYDQSNEWVGVPPYLYVVIARQNSSDVHPVTIKALPSMPAD